MNACLLCLFNYSCWVTAYWFKSKFYAVLDNLSKIYRFQILIKEFDVMMITKKKISSTYVIFNKYDRYCVVIYAIGSTSELLVINNQL